MRFGFAFAAALVALVPASAVGGVFTQHGGSVPLAMNTHAVGGYLFSSDDQFGVQGDLRLSIYPNVDFGFQGGLSRLNRSSGDRGLLRFGTDVQAQVQFASGSPVDLGIGGAFGVEIGDDFLVLTVGPEFRVSHAFPMGTSNSITPYAGLLIGFNRTDVASQDETEVTFPLRLGADLHTGSGFGFLMEFQVTKAHRYSDDFVFSAGARMPF